MRVLVVKLTSMGDVLHLLPALSDLRAQHPDVVVDWMVEDSFAEIPAWHSTVDRVIGVATRRWRKLKMANVSEFLAFWKYLRAQQYDVIIDAQGLIKSAAFARFARLNKGGLRAGFSGKSIKESPAARLYGKKVIVARGQHAIVRLRQLFAGVFDYAMPDGEPDYDPQLPQADTQDNSAARRIMLFHGTTWPTKHLPDQTWRDLAELAAEDGFEVQVAWGNDAEKLRAEWIAEDVAAVQVLPKSNLTELAQTIRTAAGAIAVDTGLGHMAAAFGVPCVSIYGSTDAALTGAVGQNQTRIQSSYSCSPCLLKKCPKLSDPSNDPPCYTVGDRDSDLHAAAIWRRLRAQIL